ncbi:MAG: energy transducer TonB [Bacteroidota bacterium]
MLYRKTCTSLLLWILLIAAPTAAMAQKAAKDTTVYNLVSVMPSYPGGTAALTKYIHEHIKYPKKARKEGLSGKVVCRFVITDEGKVDQVTVAKGVRADLDKEAVRVIRSLSGWTAGQRKGVPVNVRLSWQVRFILPPKGKATAPIQTDTEVEKEKEDPSKPVAE